MSPKAKLILESCNYDRKTILLKEIELCAGFDNPISRYVISDAYIFLGAKYRKQAIYYLAQYLRDPAWIPCAESDKSSFLSGRWIELGKAFEGEYEFDKAIIAYDNARKWCPEYPASYIKISIVMSKKGMLQESVDLLQALKKSQYYLHPVLGSCFNTAIDSYYEKMQRKQKMGYKYRPRHQVKT